MHVNTMKEKSSLSATDLVRIGLTKVVNEFLKTGTVKVDQLSVVKGEA